MDQIRKDRIAGHLAKEARFVSGPSISQLGRKGLSLLGIKKAPPAPGMALYSKSLNKKLALKPTKVTSTRQIQAQRDALDPAYLAKLQKRQAFKTVTASAKGAVAKLFRKLAEKKAGAQWLR